MTRTGGPASASTAGHWQAVARQWQQLGPPLRPTADDVFVCAAAVDRWARDNGPPRALVFGVTQELYRLPWPEGTGLIAVDRSTTMIEHVWPGPPGTVVCADWTGLPLGDASRDVVLCDGGLSVLPYPAGTGRLVRTLRRVVAPGGLCVFRLYVPPVRPEPADDVLRDLLAAKVQNLNVLKLRLGMALQEGSEGGVQLGRVWEALHAVAPDFGELAARVGWSLDHLLVINTYRDCPGRYYFPRVDEVRRLFCDDPGGFALEAIHTPAYELGERCPTVVFRRGRAVG